MAIYGLRFEHGYSVSADDFLAEKLTLEHYLGVPNVLRFVFTPGVHNITPSEMLCPAMVHTIQVVSNDNALEQTGVYRSKRMLNIGASDLSIAAAQFMEATPTINPINEELIRMVHLGQEDSPLVTIATTDQESPSYRQMLIIYWVLSYLPNLPLKCETYEAENPITFYQEIVAVFESIRGTEIKEKDLFRKLKNLFPRYNKYGFELDAFRSGLIILEKNGLVIVRDTIVGGKHQTLISLTKK